MTELDMKNKLQKANQLENELDVLEQKIEKTNLSKVVLHKSKSDDIEEIPLKYKYNPAYTALLITSTTLSLLSPNTYLNISNPTYVVSNILFGILLCKTASSLYKEHHKNRISNKLSQILSEISPEIKKSQNTKGYRILNQEQNKTNKIRNTMFIGTCVFALASSYLESKNLAGSIFNISAGVTGALFLMSQKKYKILETEKQFFLKDTLKKYRKN